jgi:hypothetical protein
MTFPTLRTGAVAQYPLERSVRFATQSVRFLDGSQQRFKLYGAGLRRWVVKLGLLDEQELSALIAFVEAQGSEAFAFTDPVSGTTVSRCIVADERLEAGMIAEGQGHATIVVEEVP